MSLFFQSFIDNLETKSISEATANSHGESETMVMVSQASSTELFHPVGKPTFIIAQDDGKDNVSP